MVREGRHVPDVARYESAVDDIVGNPNSTEMPNISSDTKRQPTSAAVDSVVEHYEALMHRLIADHATDFTEVGITMSQAKVLYVVMAAGELRMSELAARLGIGSSSASGLDDREGRGSQGALSGTQPAAAPRVADAPRPRRARRRRSLIGCPRSRHRPD